MRAVSDASQRHSVQPLKQRLWLRLRRLGPQLGVRTSLASWQHDLEEYVVNRAATVAAASAADTPAGPGAIHAAGCKRRIFHTGCNDMAQARADRST